MNILLTGTAGFIGARTAELLLDDGHQVVGVDNLNDYYDLRVKEHRLDRLVSRPNFRFVHTDLEDRDAVHALFKGASHDAVVNLAARAGVRASIEDPHAYVATNASGTLNLLESMVCNGVGKLVIASTSSLYAGQPMPFDESAVVTRPISPYAASKLAAESLCYVWHHLHGLDVTILRYFTVYGPGGRPDMAPFRFCEWIRRGEPITLHGDGNQTRDFTYIDDIARGTVAALRPVGYEIINLGGGNDPISINEMIRELGGHFGRVPVVNHAPAVSADMQDTSANISKAARLLDWKPRIPWQDGFRMTAAWHAEQGAWLDDIVM
ncbi:SDR family NAD(P)-dependent oxidoreductase [Luteolibacter flavescens]|uniref:SDR family NAD(P)-dependent oxidoreductase n=1 Tax=Luteolibacter flavescens TaxID=1859460 RepID=A0ABT3FUQ6_9BACT|nr:SDR family NAD(P)-dependent oxidoreductase [Luteolibacter flavescens]MCW1887311.1 SDR family NAD(P)-dependent oxidoreductase [Luteolibacter flavescens]